MMHIEQPFMARFGGWNEQVHPVGITEDDPRYVIAQKLFGEPNRREVVGYWQARDDEWSAFVEECAPGIPDYR